MTARQRQVIDRIDEWRVRSEEPSDGTEVAYGVDAETETMVCRVTDRASGCVSYTFLVMWLEPVWDWNALEAIGLRQVS